MRCYICVMEAIVKQKNTVVVTQRNAEIMKDFSNGVSKAEISRRHGVTPRAIDTVLSKLKTEFKCKNTYHLVATFLRKGLIK